jgi:hypothetical protein
MWAQLIKMQLKPDNDTAELDKQLRAAEQPGSGLVRTLVMHDQKDPSQVYALVVFRQRGESTRARAGSAPPGSAASRQGDDGRHLRPPA